MDEFERKFGLIYIILMTLMMIVYSIILINTSHPEIRYDFFFSKIAVGIFVVLTIIGLFFLYRLVPLSKFKSLKHGKKILYISLYLCLCQAPLLGIEYIIYQQSKDQFIIEQDYIDEILHDRAKSISEELENYMYWDSLYSTIVTQILPNSEYEIQQSNNEKFIVVNQDTLILNFHKFTSQPQSFQRKKIGDIDFYRVRSIGVSLPNEPHDLSYPSNRTLLNSLKQRGVVQGIDLIDLIHNKLD